MNFDNPPLPPPSECKLPDREEFLAFVQKHNLTGAKFKEITGLKNSLFRELCGERKTVDYPLWYRLKDWERRQ